MQTLDSMQAYREQLIAAGQQPVARIHAELQSCRFLKLVLILDDVDVILDPLVPHGLVHHSEYAHPLEA